MEYEEILQSCQQSDKIVVAVGEDKNQFTIYKDGLKIPQIIINKIIHIMLRDCQGLHCSGYSGWLADTESNSIYINIKDINEIEIK